ncbi:hypothetical protein [Microbulbifer sp. THAF38]|uniref:hypothetical protein n=1 Tax=Microbulbifer sp. THAF38 TaxID=2587856 RepID=UPI001267A04F|nr:hypothetical protein [Microbulbifer sp. THAF38]QFT54466.1 hypothetical protein FIU95_07855 [Microbulbifer sp. THAF38]
MSIENYVVTSFRFSDKESRDDFVKAFGDTVNMDNAFERYEFTKLLSNKFTEVYGEEVSFDSSIHDATVTPKEEFEAEIFLEGRGVSGLIYEMTKYLSKKLNEVYLLELLDEYYFSIYSKSDDKWVSYTKSMKEHCSDLLDDYDVLFETKLSEMVALYRSGTLSPYKKASHNEIFEKISNIEIDPYEDGYIFDIDDARITNDKGDTIITAAVRSGNTSVIFHVTQNVDHGSIQIPNEKGETPINIAESIGNKNVIDWVRKLGGHSKKLPS